MVARDGPDNCGPTSTPPDAGDGFKDQPYVADVRFYSDKDCTQNTGHVCLYAPKSVVEGGSGLHGCNPGLLPATTPFYARVEDSPFDEMQLVFTRDQTCPPNGPGAVFATLIDNKSCVEFNLVGLKLARLGLRFLPSMGRPI